MPLRTMYVFGRPHLRHLLLTEPRLNGIVPVVEDVDMFVADLLIELVTDRYVLRLKSVSNACPMAS